MWAIIILLIINFLCLCAIYSSLNDIKKALRIIKPDLAFDDAYEALPTDPKIPRKSKPKGKKK